MTWGDNYRNDLANRRAQIAAERQRLDERLDWLTQRMTEVVAAKPWLESEIAKATAELQRMKETRIENQQENFAATQEQLFKRQRQLSDWPALRDNLALTIRHCRQRYVDLAVADGALAARQLAELSRPRRITGQQSGRDFDWWPRREPPAQSSGPGR
ncbi:MAG: hypothetical protein HOQ05_03790 [Corynebacteriales bacterium]|nr:hypothetical protein [Mycobacteriales bacterium]